MIPPRREFLKTTAVTAAALFVAGEQRSEANQATSDPIRLSLIGCGGMGTNHLRLLSARKDVRVVHVCDVDQQRLDAAAKIVQDSSGTAAESTGDLRRVLDETAVDAVFIATPDHWHTPAAILALDAGKHVYVELSLIHI